jgi:hypothetical protein
MRKPVIAQLVLILFLSSFTACASGSTNETTTTVQPTVVQLEAVQVAQEKLAEQLGVSIETIQMVKVEDSEWPDTCLGLDDEGSACAQVITPGLRVIFQVDGKQYTFRTNETGSVVILERTEE